MATDKQTNRVMLPPALGSYVAVLKPREQENDDGSKTLKYSIGLLWDKAAVNDVLKPFIQTVERIFVQKFGEKELPAFRLGKKYKNPLRDGDIDRHDDKHYAGKVFINASSKNQPGCVDARVTPVFEEDECYSGCTFRASVNVFAFEKKGNKGIAIGLNNVQVVKKGPRIDGRKAAEDEFKEFAEEGGASNVTDIVD